MQNHGYTIIAKIFEIEATKKCENERGTKHPKVPDSIFFLTTALLRGFIF